MWLYFYRLFISDQQAGLLDAVAFAIGLLAEVPSGALADRIGRHRAVRIGQLLAGSGLLIQAIGGGFVPLFVGQTILMVGAALTSGADEALFFEKLDFPRESAHWRKLMTRVSQATVIGLLVATISGGYLHTIDPRLPWVLNGIVFLASIAIIWPVDDVRPQRTRQPLAGEVRSYLSDIRTGFAQFRLPQLRPYVPVIFIVQSLFYTFGWGLLQLLLLSRFDFSPFIGSVIVGGTGLLTVAILFFMHRYAERISERAGIVGISLAAAAALLLAVADLGWWGFLVILVLNSGEPLLGPFMSEVLNNRAPVDQRSTVLSVASFFENLPYVVLAPLLGYLSTSGRLEVFLLAWPVLIVIAVGIYLATSKGGRKVRLTN